MPYRAPGIRPPRSWEGMFGSVRLAGVLQGLPGMPCRASGSWLRTWREGRARSRWSVSEFASPAGRPCRALRILPGTCSAHRATICPVSGHGLCACAGHPELSDGRPRAQLRAYLPSEHGRVRRKRSACRAPPGWALFRARSRPAAAEPSNFRWSRSLEAPAPRGLPPGRPRRPGPPGDSASR
jgi:hypothetical protein